MYEDQPMWCAYDQAKKSFFADHPLGNSVLGSTDSVGGLTREQMHAYFQRRYVAENIVVAVAGNFAWRERRRPAGKTLRRLALGQGAAQEHSSRRRPQVLRGRAQEKGAARARLPDRPGPIGQLADAARGRHAGDDRRRRFRQPPALGPRSIRALPTRPTSASYDYEGAGALFLLSKLRPGQDARTTWPSSARVLRKVQKDGVTREELDQAKSKILSRVVRGSERPMGRMRALGTAWTYLGKYRSVDDELKAFEAVTERKIEQVIERYPFNEMTILALGPLRKLRRPRSRARSTV